MALETERKFLLRNDDWRRLIAESWRIEQGYLANSSLATVRVRVVDDDAWLTIKSAETGRVRQEFEYEIATEDARQILETLALSRIAKTRHRLNVESTAIWTVDEFSDANTGLFLLEVEGHDDREPTAFSWMGREVTEERGFYNDELSRRPIIEWSDDERKLLQPSADLR